LLLSNSRLLGDTALLLRGCLIFLLFFDIVIGAFKLLLNEGTGIAMLACVVLRCDAGLAFINLQASLSKQGSRCTDVLVCVIGSARDVVKSMACAHRS
jgi:hypothetical protein